ILGMLACLLLACLRTFSPTGHTVIAVLPLALGAARSIYLGFQLIPPIGILLDGGASIDLDWVLLGTLSDIRMLLIFGLAFSFASVLAILLRHRRKATAA